MLDQSRLFISFDVVASSYIHVIASSNLGVASADGSLLAKISRDADLFESLLLFSLADFCLSKATAVVCLLIIYPQTCVPLLQFCLNDEAKVTPAELKRF